MSAIETLESVTALLPPENRERFLKMAARFRSVPEDDEYLQILEAIGFMTLLWREVPKEIEQILGKASPVSETVQGVSGMVRDVVVEAIPSYDDLKNISQRLEAHELALKNTLNASVKTNAPIAARFWGINFFTVGVTVGLLAHEYLLPLLP